MNWKPIATAPISQTGMLSMQILVGFQGQYAWFSYVAEARGDQTGKHMPFAPPTHWTEIIPPDLGETS